MRDTTLTTINIIFCAIALTVLIATFVACVWSDNDRSTAPLHRISTHAHNVHPKPEGV